MNATLLFVAATVGAPALKDRPPPEASIKGEWKVESRLDHGKPSTDQNHWIFSDGGVAVIRDATGETVRSHLTYTVSAAGPVKELDFLEGQGVGRGNQRQGIYKIDGDTLTLSFTCGNTPRPTSFDPSNEGYVLVLKRVKK
jgi:uncharacterized protein (TIGR03067 family)